MSDWIMLIPSQVFTRLKSGLSEKLKKKYGIKSENFSMVARSNTDAVFPFVYVNALTSMEEGADLEGSTINAAMFTFQIEVTDNVSQNRTKEVMAEIINIAKAMRFELVSLPMFENMDGTHRCIIRIRRIIGANDAL